MARPGGTCCRRPAAGVIQSNAEASAGSPRGLGLALGPLQFHHERLERLDVHLRLGVFPPVLDGVFLEFLQKLRTFILDDLVLDLIEREVSPRDLRSHPEKVNPRAADDGLAHFAELEAGYRLRELRLELASRHKAQLAAIALECR